MFDSSAWSVNSENVWLVLIVICEGRKLIVAMNLLLPLSISLIFIEHINEFIIIPMGGTKYHSKIMKHSTLRLNSEFFYTGNWGLFLESPLRQANVGCL